GMFNDIVYQLVDDTRGNFWMTCNKGVSRVSRKELNDFAAGKIKSVHAISYNVDDGMKNNECNTASPSGIRARDGKLWFPTVDGVAVVDPLHMRFNVEAPPVLLEEVVIDGK